MVSTYRTTVHVGFCVCVCEKPYGVWSSRAQKPRTLAAVSGKHLLAPWAAYVSYTIMRLADWPLITIVPKTV